MKKLKRTVPGASIRNVWTRNPVTRVHDNDIRKDQKKERQANRRDLRSICNNLQPNGQQPPQKGCSYSQEQPFKIAIILGLY